MDHLTEAFIVQDGYSPTCGYTPIQIKEAALCLMLNPNAHWARFTLVCYAMFKKVNSDRATDMAIVSMTAQRVARGIHTYDRERQSLRQFVFRCYCNAEKDVYAMLRQAVPDAEYIGRRPGKTLDDMIIEHGGTERYNKLIDELFGSFITMPLKKRAEDRTLEPLHFWTYDMSFDEVRRALQLCAEKHTPVGIQMTGLPLIPTKKDREGELLEFEAWCKLSKPPKFYQEVEHIICRAYHVEGITSINKIITHLEAAGHSRTYGEVKSCIYDKFKKFLPMALPAAEKPVNLEHSSGGASK